MSRIFLSLEVLGENLFLASCNFRCLRALAWEYITSVLYDLSLQGSVVTRPSHLWSNLPLLPSQRTLKIAFRAHLDNPGLYPHFQPPPPAFFFWPHTIAFTSYKDLDMAVFGGIIIHSTTPFVKRSNIKIHFLK